MRSDTEPNARGVESRRVESPGRTTERSCAAPRRAGGFTIIELAVALAVIAILARIAVPALHGFLMSNSMTAATNQLVASLNYARNQALAEHSKVVFCKTTNTAASSPTCDSGSSPGFEEGWVVYNTYTDNTGSNVTRVLKSVVPDSASNLAIKASNSIKSQIRFNAFGRATDSSDNALATNVYFVLCDTRQWATNGQYARVVTIQTTGQITSQVGNKQSDVTSCSP